MVAITEVRRPFPRLAPESIPDAGPPRHPHLREIPGTGSGVPRARSTTAISAARITTVVLFALAGLLAVTGSAYLLLSDPLAVSSTIAAEDATYLVLEGDTMWSISQRLAPAGEAGQFLERLVALNGTSTVEPGQELLIPIG